jgi:3-phenylpropionate/trans-cinnamate dioxygenase ferredoxin reductase subunit
MPCMPAGVRLFCESLGTILIFGLPVSGDPLVSFLTAAPTRHAPAVVSCRVQGVDVSTSKFTILGGGMVAGYAAKQLVEFGLKPGDLTIVSADNTVPYERPPLSKGFLAGRETESAIRINPEDFYRDHGIDLRLQTEAIGLAPSAKSIHLRSGEELGFDALILATGSRVRMLDVPGADLEGVYYLRSLDDSKRIRSHAEHARRAVVLGGGFIGMEVASVLAQKQIETTMVLREDRIWKQFFSPEMSRFFEAYYAARGVRFQKTASIAGIRGTGAVNGVVLTNGQTVPSDMVVAGIGVLPVTDFMAAGGIEIQDGVMVNQYLETNRPGIYAAGDIANYQDVLFGKRRRVEHWDNAVAQGQHCARMLTGERKEFRHVPYFFSDVFDLSYEFWGDPEGAEETIHRGDVTTSSFSAWWVRGQRLVAAFAMNRPEEEREVAPKWVESRERVSSTRLADASRSIADAAEIAHSAQ